MEPKYYTMTEKDICIGLEFEFPIYSVEKKTTEYVKSIFDFNTIEYFFNKDSDGKYSISEIFRIKYLDRSDLEELGWKVKVWSFGSGYFYIDKYTLGLHSIDSESKIFMYCTISKNDNGNNVVLFSGTIKNKAELARIMKQTNIV
jgi:hypothetical protein